MAATADELVWIIRFVLFVGLGWGTWLCISHALMPERSQKMLELEHFATYVLIVLLLSTLGTVLHAG